MRIINLIITDADGIKRIVPHYVADDGKVLMDKYGATVTSIEADLISEFIEITIPTEEEPTAEELLNIIMGEE